MTKSNHRQIIDFQKAISGTLPTLPETPSDKVVALRRTLIQEEFAEVMEAFDNIEAASDKPAASNPLFVELMHELADLLYVTYGTFAEFGVDADAVFAEVHRANMQKANGPRREDGKVMKPPDFCPADVAGTIANQPPLSDPSYKNGVSK